MNVTSLTWGQVTGLTPTEVRFAGDTVSQVVGLKDSGLTVATNDKVLLARAGQPDAWVIVCKIGATT